MPSTRATLATLIALSLFVGGIILLLSHIPFWSFFLGLPASQIGIVLLILTYERLSKKSLHEKIEEQILKRKEPEQ